MEKIKVDNKIIEYRIIRTKRKTIGICVSPEKGVLIRSPRGLSNTKVEEIVYKKADWILKKLEEVSQIPLPDPLEFVSGEKIPYTGKYFEIHIYFKDDIKGAIIDFDQMYFNIYVRTDLKDKERKIIIRDSLIKWYRKQAGYEINNSIEKYKKYIEKEPVNVRIKKQKRIWGSCSSRGNLNFNWKLIMAPLPVLDYIVVHELAHLVHPNHSRKFWELVEKIIPEYRKRQEWLKINGLLLNIL